MANKRPTYSREQVAQYYDRLNLPDEQREFDIAGLKPEDELAYLSLLQKLHLVAIPFENLTLHYSHHRQVTVHPEELFKKIIGDNNGRGGYCMENNCLFGTLLRSIGFKLYSAGGRVYEGDHWSGWAHMVNIVTIGGSRYHVDVGFGANGPTKPLELDRNGVTHEQIPPASMRLSWRNLPENTDEDQRLWVYEHRMDDKSEFQTTYCFSELEFLPYDYIVANYYTSTNPKVLFTQRIIGEKKILGGDKDDELVGNLILSNNDLKWRIRGNKEREIKFNSEEDRLKALEDHFGIRFSESERDSNKGMVSQIR
ncbi:arylamine N-acetyltransferase 1 [Lophiotrema nucula]|uniref:Arylamine N-acetyltransferase 1 n=1 Tax=Lophiotrema nucula TaxID=690887 RepID=A0A6A5ZBH1_9PLEO|nr:arylamine N-acetyltransferase 1 [Lophiotrema nucula]